MKKSNELKFHFKVDTKTLNNIKKSSDKLKRQSEQVKALINKMNSELKYINSSYIKIQAKPWSNN